MMLNADDWRREARRRLPRFVFDYVDGAADDGLCLRRNQTDLDAITLKPRVLRDTSTIETSVEIFGRRWAMPVGVAPTGLNGLVRPGGDGLLAAAAAGARVAARRDRRTRVGRWQRRRRRGARRLPEWRRQSRCPG